MKRLIAGLTALCLLMGMASWALGTSGTFAAAEDAATETPAQTAAPAADTGGSQTDTGAAQPAEATAAPASSESDGTGDTDTGDTDTGDTDTGDADAGDTGTDESTAGESATAEPSAEPTETPAPAEADPAATETPAAEGSDPTATETPATEEDPYLAPTPEVPPVEADVGSGPAWVAEGAHRHYGDLDTLLPIAMVSGVTIVLASPEVFEVTGYALEDLRALSYGVDHDALGEYADGRRVILSAIGPSGQMDSGVVYVWVGLPDSVPSVGDGLGEQIDLPEDGGEPAVEVMVEASGYTAGEACTPTFTLHAIPGLSEGMAFAVVVDGGAAQAIGGEVYTPGASGQYSFAVIDSTGTVVAQSITYDVTLADAQATAEPLPESGTDESGTLTPEDVEAEVSLTEAMGEPEALEIIVHPHDYVEGVRSTVTPSFTLSGAPAEGGYAYGISINGATPVPLQRDTYAETSSGEFTYVFYILDAQGVVASSSILFHVVLDFSTASQTGDAWMQSGSEKQYGSLGSLLRLADGGETIYLLTTEVQAVSSGSALASVRLAADPDRYGSEYDVVVSDVSPAGESTDGVTYVWLGADVETMTLAATLDASPTFSVDMITIGSRTLSGGMWVNGHDAVSFTITDSDPSHTYQIEASVNGGVTFVSFGDGSTLGGLGLSTGDSASLAFRVTVAGDETNTLTTSVIAVQYDNTAPTLICRAGDGGTLTFYAGDTASGFGSQKNVTFNATASPITWTARLSHQGGGVYTYSVRYDHAGTIAAGTLGVRDQAGNVAVWGEAIEITTGGGGGRSGTGGSTSGGRGGGRSVYHSASLYSTVTVYGGVDLMVQTGEMDILTIGETQLPLYLLTDDGTGTAVPFTASLCTWGATETSTETADTLVLTGTGGEGSFVWAFNGTVYRQLAASGIHYLVLNVGQRAVALSTAGFSAGVRYSLYRMAGLASGAFDYAVRMDAQNSFAMSVTVDGETWALTSDAQSEFYYYDVLSGTVDMLSLPFGQAAGQDAA